MSDNQNARIQEAREFCKYELKIPSAFEGDKTMILYLNRVFDRVYLCALESNDPSLPFLFTNDIRFAHEHANTLREHVETIRKNPQEMLSWEKATYNAIDELDTAIQEDHLRFFDISTETLKRIVCERK